MQQKKILITGASGFIGSNLVEALVKKGYNVKALVRRTSSSSFLQSLPNVEICYGDMTDKDSLIRATKDTDAVIHLAAATSEKRSSAKESYEVNVTGTADLIDACKKSGVRRLIVISTQSTKREKQGKYGATKQRADELVQQSGLAYTIVKPTLVYGKGAKGLFAKVLALVKKLPAIPVVGSGEYKLQPTYIGDLTAALISILEKKETIGKVYDLAGGTRMAFNEFLQEICSQLQLKKKIIHVPFWLCYAGTKTLSSFTKNPPLTADNILGLVQETSVDLTPAQQDFGYQPISFAEGLQKTLWREDDPTRKNIGIIGLGKMGILHASLINTFPNARIAALFDVDRKAGNYAAGMNLNAPFFTDIDKFLDNVKPDAVFIAVPPAFTLPTIKKCAAHNISFFVEKPLADTLERAEQIVQLAEKHKLVNAVGYMYAYRPLVQKAKELLQQGVLGKISSFTGTAFMTQVLSPKKGWRYEKKAAGGGCMSLHGTHLLYLLYFFFGVPKRVAATLEFPFSAVEDKADAIFTYTDFAGTIKVSWSEKGHPKLALEMTVAGENGKLTLVEDRITLKLIQNTSPVQNKKPFPAGETVILRDELAFSAFELGGDGYYEQDKAFVDALFAKTNVMVSVHDAFTVQKMLQAIYDAHEKKSEVAL